MPGRRAPWLLPAAAVALVAAALAPAATTHAHETETLVVTAQDTAPARTRYAYTAKTPFTLIVTGTITYEPPGGGRKTTLDALYCVTCPDREARSPLVLDSKLKHIPSTSGGLWDYNFVGLGPKYSASHRYEIPFAAAEYGFLAFSIDRGCSTCRYSGSFSIRVVPRGKPEPEVNLRVDFLVRASGRPNVPIKGAGEQPANARLTGSGHATFTKKSGSRLEATETKGSVVHVHGDRRLQLGIVSGSSYYPSTRRLVLLLKVNGSNDPRCEESGFLTGTRVATLTLLPVTGEPDLGTVIFAGVPIKKQILPGLSVEPCKGHFHGWEGGGDGVSVRVVVRESKA